jgi:copper chaperone NosL
VLGGLKENLIMDRKYFLVAIFCFLQACTPQPQPIEYGSDNCVYCRMTIVDERHAAELVTQKGKAFKFDAIECMVAYEKTVKSEDIAFILVSDYQTGGELLPAETCTFLISPSIPSPMGANLSAFKDKKSALDFQKNEGDLIYTWQELKSNLKPK